MRKGGRRLEREEETGGRNPGWSEATWGQDQHGGLQTPEGHEEGKQPQSAGKDNKTDSSQSLQKGLGPVTPRY